MLGTVVNAAAIVVGSLLGLLLKGGLKENYRATLSAAVNLSVVLVGAGGALGAMLDKEANPVLFIVSLVLGGLLGEWLRIEGRLESLGRRLQNSIHPKGNAAQSGLAQGFVASSLAFCVGTMAVLGSIESGVRGNHSVLFAKALIDGIISLVMASTMGIGVLFSAASVFLYQGAVTLLAGWISPWLTAEMLREISIVGGVMIAVIGLNMLEVFKSRVRVGNMLPSLLVPVAYYALLGLVNRQAFTG